MHNIPGRTDWRWNIFREYKNIYNPVFISQKQKENTHNYSGIDFKHSWVVYNSTDTEHFDYNETPEDYFIWLGLITKVKGIENAIAAAKKAGVKLKIAGKQNEHNSEYFDQMIKPQLDDKIEFVGELGGQELVNFYRNAKALVYPIEWEEPFGLIMTEALACGTPVIAYPRGAVPEIVSHGENGFIVSSIDETAEAIKNIDQIDRKKCRQTVLEKFNINAMVGSYLEIYKELAHP
jgi:glycosyltransferase involved in cell wall biosynthesis